MKEKDYFDFGLYAPFVGTTWTSETSDFQHLLEELIKFAQTNKGVCYVTILIIVNRQERWQNVIDLNLNTSKLGRWDTELSGHNHNPEECRVAGETLARFILFCLAKMWEP